MQPILTLHNVTRRFGGLVAVNDVSFDVPAQGVTAVIGPNGAGKTTLFNLISGFLSPSAGHILFHGADITGGAPETIAARGLVRTFQLAKPFGDLTALENVKVGQHLHTQAGLWAALLRTQTAQREEQAVAVKAQEWLAMVGLSLQANTRAGVLPYGQLRLLEVARALAAEPKLLLLDEPAAGLNGEEASALAQLIRRIAESGTAVLLIEHDMTLVMNTADHVMVFDFGRKIAAGSPDEVNRNKSVIAAYLGEPALDGAGVGHA
jgi:branched-chain amino acid transport system ATP-binding protein